MRATMKSKLITLVSLAALGTGAAAFADDDCEVPVADWQPRDALRQKLEAQGWEVHRIKVDDGCYEVKGFDQDGNEVEAEYAPDTLAIRKLETTYYRNDDDRSDDRRYDDDDDYDDDERYDRDAMNGSAAERAAPGTQPKVSIE